MRPYVLTESMHSREMSVAKELRKVAWACLASIVFVNPALAQSCKKKMGNAGYAYINTPGKSQGSRFKFIETADKIIDDKGMPTSFTFGKKASVDGSIVVRGVEIKCSSLIDNKLVCDDFIINFGDPSYVDTSSDNPGKKGFVAAFNDLFKNPFLSQKKENLVKTLPSDWNVQPLTELGDIISVNKGNQFYAPLAANGGITVKDGGVRDYQPNLPEFRNSSVIATQKSWNWQKRLIQCSPPQEVKYLYSLNALLIPLPQYAGFLKGWEDSVYSPSSTSWGVSRYCGADTEECRTHFRRASESLSKFFSQPDVIPVTINIIVSFEVEKVNLDF